MNDHRTPRDVIERRIATLERRANYQAGRADLLDELMTQPELAAYARTYEALRTLRETAAAARDLAAAELAALRAELDEEAA